MYEKSLVKLILWLAWPMVVTASINSLYQLADTIWLGRLGAAALGTPALSWPFMMLFNSVGFGLSASVSALVGQYVGAGDYRSASKAYGNILALFLAIGVPVTIAAELLAPVYVRLTRMPSDIAGLASTYISIIVAGLPALYIFMLYATGLNALGDTRTPMKLGLASTLANVILDPILIFPPVGLGVAGAAIATLVSNVGVTGYVLYALARGMHGLRVRLEDLRIEKSIVSKAMRVSSPVIGQQLATAAGFSVMAGIVAGLGTAVAAAYSIGQALLSIDRIVLMPLARSASIIVSQSLGAELIDRAKKAARLSLGLIALLGAAIVAFVVLARGPFIALFTSDPIVFPEASRMILIFAPSALFFEFLMLGNAVARASGHTLFMSIVSVVRLWGLRITLSYLLAYVLGMASTGLWLGMAISNYVTGAASVAWILASTWAKPIIRPRRIPQYSSVEGG